jgi:catechol 2,3-dioxygenase-like lactoylglutathione lyase family enzyme
MRLRQVALAATDLASTIDLLTDVLGIEVGFRDPGVGVFGLENAVMPVGEMHLEVVSPVRDDATAKRWIEKRGGDSGYMVILQCDDQAALDRKAARAQESGAKVVWQGEHHGARTVHFHPRDLGAILSFDALPGWDDWIWGGPDWRAHIRTETTTAITGVELESPDPGRLAARWGEVLGIPPQGGEDGQPTIALPRGGRLDFVPSEGGEGVSGIALALTDAARFEERARARGVLGADGAATIAGTRFFAA